MSTILAATRHYIMQHQRRLRSEHYQANTPSVVGLSASVLEIGTWKWNSWSFENFSPKWWIKSDCGSLWSITINSISSKQLGPVGKYPRYKSWGRKLSVICRSHQNLCQQTLLEFGYFLPGKKLIPVVQNIFEEFASSRLAGFFKKVINELTLSWQSCINCCVVSYYD